jgi:hypothetical protein
MEGVDDHRERRSRELLDRPPYSGLFASLASVGCLGVARDAARSGESISVRVHISLLCLAG